MSSIVSAFKAVIATLDAVVNSVQGSQALLNLFTMPLEYRRMEEKLYNFLAGDQTEEVKKEIEDLKEKMKEFAVLPTPRHKNRAWIIELIYDDVSLANRADWAEARFTPPKFLVMDRTNRQEVIRQARKIRSIGEKFVVAANYGYADPAEMQFHMALATKNWQRSLNKEVQENEYASRLANKRQRIENWKKRLAEGS